MTVPKRLKPLAPDAFAPTKAQVASAKALATGTAAEHQQLMFYNMILKELGGIGLQSYRRDPYETAFMEGRRFVAVQIMGMLATPQSTIRDNDT